MTSSGAMMAAVDEFDIIVKGKGGHAATPHLTTDPIVIASTNSFISTNNY